MDMLGILLINYKAHEEVLHYVQHELTKIRLPYQVAIVDNSCDPIETDALKEGFAKNGSLDDYVHVLQSAENIGYAKANNWAAQYLMERYEIDYLLISNTDIEFVDDDVIDYLVEKMKREKIVHIGPAILDGESLEFQRSPSHYESFFRRYVVEMLFSLLLVKPLKYIFPLKLKKIYNDGSFSNGIYYKLTGSLLVINASVFKEVGMYDENTFLMAEEVILSERLLKHGYSSYFDQSRSVLHHESQTIRQHYPSFRKRLYVMIRAEKYYYHHYRKIPLWLLSLVGPIAVEIYTRINLPLRNLLKRVGRLRQRIKKNFLKNLNKDSS